MPSWLGRSWAAPPVNGPGRHCAVIEAEGADPCDEQSLRWMWNELEYEGDYFGDLPDGGYASVVGALARGVDVRFGEAVNGVVLKPDGVSVRAGSGVIEASHAVITVPLGVLKQGRPGFRPPLPADRVQAMDRLGFGRFEKVALALNGPSGVMRAPVTSSCFLRIRTNPRCGCSASTASAEDPSCSP